MGALFLVNSIAGLVLLTQNNHQTGLASRYIRETLLPAGRLIEEARTELDLQIQEIALKVSEGKTQFGEAQMGLLQLGPSTIALEKVSQSPSFPAGLRPLVESWSRTSLGYSASVTRYKNLSESIPHLKELRQKTSILYRGVDRELRLQMLELSQKSSTAAAIGALLLVLSLVEFVFFAVFLTKWMAPLGAAQKWLTASKNQWPRDSLPPLPVGSGPSLFSPPAEVFLLLSSLRDHLQEFQQQARELRTRAEKTRENERAMGTLFTGLQVLVKNNEDLLAELIKKERLASMGEMAAQLAHEIRNPLNALNLKLELLREDLGPEQQKILDRVLGEIDRLNALTESHLRTTRAHLGLESPLKLTSTSDNPTRNQDICDLADAIDSSLEMVKPQLDAHKIHVEVSLAIGGLHTTDTHQAPRPRVFLSPNILKAVLVNLIKNAAESLAQTQNNKIWIFLKSSDEAGKVHLQILDQGVGFPDSILKNGFKRFFTTKPQGSGLGLSTAESMLLAFGIRLRVLSPSLLPTGFKAGIQIENLKIQGPRPTFFNSPDKIPNIEENR